MASVTTLLCLAFALFIAQSSAQPTSRILGGDEALAGVYPYAVSVRTDGVHNCGGTIIGTKTIITAASCVFEKGTKVPVSRLSIRAGSTNQFAGGKIVQVSSVVVHSEYKDYKNNLALIHLSSALEVSEKIQSIAYATTSSEEAAVGATVRVAGWGEQSDGGSAYKLHFTTFTVAASDVCLDAYSAADASVVCLAHALQKGSCYGDAGNGATFSDRLVGVANFVVGACGARYPDVFTNVSHYAEWITKNLI